MGEADADATGEGDSTGVAKFVPSASLLNSGRGVGTGVNWGPKILTLFGMAAAAAVCASTFVFDVVFVRAFVPVCVAAVELPLEPASPPATPPVIPPV